MEEEEGGIKRKEESEGKESIKRRNQDHLVLVRA